MEDGSRPSTAVCFWNSWPDCALLFQYSSVHVQYQGNVCAPMSAVGQETRPLCRCLHRCSLVWVLAVALAATPTLLAMAGPSRLAIWVLGVAGWRPGLQLASARPHVMLCRYFLGPGQQVPQVLALGLSSRKNLCIHPSVAGGDMAELSGGIFRCHKATPQNVHPMSWQGTLDHLQSIWVALHVRPHHKKCIPCHGR